MWTFGCMHLKWMKWISFRIFFKEKVQSQYVFGIHFQQHATLADASHFLFLLPVRWVSPSVLAFVGKIGLD